MRGERIQDREKLQNKVATKVKGNLSGKTKSQASTFFLGGGDYVEVIWSCFPEYASGWSEKNIPGIFFSLHFFWL